MKIILRLFLVIFLSGSWLTLIGCSSSDNNTPLLPERLTFAGIGEHGIFDPAVTLDTDTGRLWMSYSAVDPSV
ncbi:MAG TPA: hypothetical protein VFY78_02710, partial [Gammaproteobacteria bacterium]|nr:hypothetical protein [Gammaproteobacteria bacterium]